MKKQKLHVRIAVSLLLAVVLLFGAIAVTASAAFDKNAGTNLADRTWWTVNYVSAAESADGVAKLNVMLKTDVLEYADINREDLKTDLKEVLDALYEIAYDSIFPDTVPTAVSETADDGGLDIPPSLDISDVDLGKLESFLKDQLDSTDKELAKEKLDAIINGEYDNIIKVAVDKFASGKGYTYEEIAAKTHTVLEEIITDLYADEPQLAEEKKQATENKVNGIVYDVKVAHESGESITIGVDDLKHIDSLSVDDKYVFVNGSINNAAVKELVSQLPRPSEIKDFTDDEMMLDYRIKAEFVFGTIEFDLAFGFIGDCSAVRSIAAIVARYITFDFADGTFVIDIDVPDGFGELVIRALNSDKLSDELKHKIFEHLDDNGDDVHAMLKNFSFDDFIDLISAIDVEGLLDKEFIKDFVDLSHLTNDEIIDKVKQYEGYYNKALEIVSRALNKVPDVYMTKTLFDAYDGDGVFNIAAAEDVNIEAWLTKISSKYGPLVASYFENETVRVSVDLTVAFENVNRVTYVVSDNVTLRDGFLPAGADIAYFADLTAYEGKNITAWMDGEGVFYDKMPDADIVLYPYYGGTLTATLDGNVSAGYDKDTTHTLTVDKTYLPIGDAPVFTYQWYCDGAVIEGQTESTLTLKYVADSGVYYCKVSVVDGDYNTSVDTNTVTVSITPGTIDITGAAWNYTSSFIYDGQPKSVAITGLPTGVTPSYSNFHANNTPITGDIINAGSYITTVSFAYDNANYTLTGNSIAPSLEWKIDKATYDMSGITFADSMVYYDGEAHGIVIGGTLPAGVSVSYSASKTEVGVYTITASFQGDNTNYNPIPDKTATLTILAVVTPPDTPVTPPDTPDTPDTPVTPPEQGESNFTYRNENGDVVVDVTSDNPLAPGVELSVSDKTEDYRDFDFSPAVAEDERAVLGAAYDIHFNKDGAETDVNGNNFTVKLLIPEDLRNKGRLIVVHVGDDGTLTVMDGAERDGDHMVFDTTHFSVYAVLAVEDEAPNLLWLWIVILVLIVVIILLIIFRRRPEDKEENTEEPTNDGSSEATEPENPEETKEEAGEVFVEEIPAEEPPVEEVPNEEVVAEVVPEAAPVEEKPKDTKVPIFINTDDTIVVDGNVIYIRYRSSFMSRLIQSDSEVQGYYTQVKNYILSYKGVKARGSFNWENFNRKRDSLVRINVKGKALFVYLALNPADYNEQKYHFTDESADKKFADVPMLMKVRSDRALKYVLELIDEVMKKAEITQGEIPTVDYSMPYEPNNVLATKGLVKVILPPGVKFDTNASYREADVGALLENERAERAAEEADDIEDNFDVDILGAADENAPKVRYRSSFMSRLIQSKDITKAYYGKIKNYLLSYVGIKSRSAWGYETFVKGRTSCVRLFVKGKTLAVNLALDPKLYKTTKYHHLDLSEVIKHKKMPMQIRVRSDRGLKYALELIDEVMKNVGVARGDMPAVDYSMPYESNEALLERGLVKVVERKGNKATFLDEQEAKRAKN